MADLESVLGTPPLNSSSISESLSRRNVLAGLAVLPAALPVSAMVVEPDPIFALIEAKRAADVAHLAACLANSEEADVADEQSELACHAAYDAAEMLALTPPTTLAGVLAVLKFVTELEVGDWPEEMGLEDQLLRTTAQAIETIIGKGAV